MLEGFHALKHALRFGAECRGGLAADAAELEELRAELAPDLAGRSRGRATPVDAEVLAGAGPAGAAHRGRRDRPPPAQVDLAALLADPRPAPVVLLEDPRDDGQHGRLRAGRRRGRRGRAS